MITKQQKENERRHRNDRVVNKATPTIADADGGYKRIGPISFAIGSISGTFVVCSPGGVEATSSSYSNTFAEELLLLYIYMCMYVCVRVYIYIYIYTSDHRIAYAFFGLKILFLYYY